MIDVSEQAILELGEGFSPPRGGRSRRPRRSPASRRAVLAAEIARLAAEIDEAETEALRLAVPLPSAREFHSSQHQIKIVTGSNQSAKTFHELFEAGRAISGSDPYNKYPKKNGRAVFVGYDSDHLADPFYKKLFLEGEFQIIPDEHTNKWRAVRPDPANPQQLDPYDVAYREKWRNAPPFIPPKLVADVAWEQRNKNVPRIVKLTNGWEILWRSSNGRPPRGRQIHLALLDEDLQNTYAWINELIPRLLKHEGRMIWAATAQEGGPELYELCQKAEAGSPHVAMYRLLIVDNPYISDEQRAFFLDTLTSDEERAVRYYGENAVAGRIIYRDYDPNGVHGCEPFPVPIQDWCRYVILDPGRKHCATLFGAVDPEEKHRWIYDGMDIQQSEGHAQRWANEVAARQGDMRFEAFVIDQHMGREKYVGLVEKHMENVAQQYWRALQDIGIQPRRSGPLNGFFPGSGDIPAREQSLIAWMQVRGTGPFAGTPFLQVMRGVIPKLDRQINLAQTDASNTRHVEKRMKLEEDLLVCLEYFAAFNPGYYPPEPVYKSVVTKPLTVPQQLSEKRKRLQQRRQQTPGQTFGSAMEIGR